MRILVTGGTGFIGTHVVRRALAAGHEVVVVARKTGGVVPSRAHFFVGDVTQPETLHRAMAGVDAVVHAAAAVGGLASAADHRRVTVMGTANVLDAAVRAGVSRFVHVSTLAVHEPAPWIRDDSPLAQGVPLWNRYVRAKLAAERHVEEVARSAALRAAILRPGLVLGAGDRHLAPRLMAWLRHGLAPTFGDGRNRLPCVSAEAVAEAAMAVVETPEARGAYVLASRERVTQEDLWRLHAEAADLTYRQVRVPRRLARGTAAFAETIAPALALELPFTRFDLLALVSDVCVDPIRAAREWGWSDPIAPAEAIARSVRPRKPGATPTGEGAGEGERRRPIRRPATAEGVCGS